MKERSIVFPISTVCEATGLSPRQVRYLEHTGLLAPERRGSRRWFTEEDLRRAQLIKRWRDHGYSLQRIRFLLRDAPTAAPQANREIDPDQFDDVKLFFRRSWPNGVQR